MNNSIEIGDTDLKTRTLTVLWRVGHRTVADLHGVTAADLMPLPGFGKDCLDDLRRGMEPYGVVIHDDDNPLTMPQTLWALRTGVTAEMFAAGRGIEAKHAEEAFAICREHGLVTA